MQSITGSLRKAYSGWKVVRWKKIYHLVVGIIMAISGATIVLTTHTKPYTNGGKWRWYLSF